MARAVAAALVLLLVGCDLDWNSVSAAWRRAGAQSSLEVLLIDPINLPTHCSLTWESKPLFFQPTEKYPNDFLGFVIGQFWLPPTSGIDLRSVVLGVSNVYVSPSSEHAVVSVSIVFENDAMAGQAQRYLESAFATRPGFTVARKHRLISLFAPHSSVGQDCAAYLLIHV